MKTQLPPVLIVDDEKNMRLSLKSVLAAERYAVRAVDSAEEALNLLAQEDFFMVITDARLGGMSGYEFLAKAHTQWPDLPILMITAYVGCCGRPRSVDVLLAKPFTLDDLRKAISRVLSSPKSSCTGATNESLWPPVTSPTTCA